MLLDNFVCKAVFAATRKLEKAWEWSDLKHQRDEALRAQLGVSRRRQESCFCRGAGPKVFGSLPRMRPIIGYMQNDDFAVPVPLDYLAWRVRDCVMPGIELFELPSPGGLDERPAPAESLRHETLFHSVRALKDLPGMPTDAPPDWGEVLTPALLWELRRSIILEVFDRNPKFGHVYFSMLDFGAACAEHSMPREPAPGEVFLQKYAKAQGECLRASQWEIHQERILCASDEDGLLPVPLKTFVVVRHDRFLHSF